MRTTPTSTEGTRRRWLLPPAALVLGLAVPLTVVGSVSAEADQPVHNGRITFGRDDPALGATSLWVADANGRHQQRLTQDPTGFSDWSPDGERIAFDFVDDVGDVHLAVIRPDGTGRRSLTTAPGVQEVPSWSPDGRLIAFDAFDPAQPVFSTSIWVMAGDGTQQRQVTSDGFDVEPAFSPSGKQIVFARIVEDLPVNARVAVYVVNTDGTGLRQVVPPRAGLEHPDWSPDGRSITFNIGPEGDAHGSGSVFSVRPNGEHLRVLLAAGEHKVFFKAKWSPDGRRLLVGCFDDRVGVEQLCTSSAAGDQVRTVRLGGDAAVNFPAWGPARASHGD